MTVFTDKSKIYVPRLMQDLSITREQACGIFGNIGGETGGFAALQEKKPTVKGSRGGFGWLQWTGPRRTKYEAWCKQNGNDPSSDEANYRYLVIETKTDEAHSLEQLRKTTTVPAATETFMAVNLRPGVKNLQARLKWADQAYDATKLVEVKKNEEVAKTTTVTATAGFAAIAAMFFQEHWVAIVAVIAALGGITYFLVHEHHQEEKNKVLEQQASKKGNK